jgi:ubiquinone biosynthesis protein Coq4
MSRGDVRELARAMVERGSTLGEAASALATREHVLANDRALLEDPAYRRLYDARAALPAPPVEATRALPIGTLGRCYADYMAHYRLSPDFFPVDAPLGPAMTPTAYAVYRLNRAHDLLHVLGEYETHDRDEAGIQSFVLGNSPVAQAAFLATALADPSVRLLRYKHLRDIADARIQPEDYARGARAAPLLSLPFERSLAASLAVLRRRWRVAPRREPPAATDNTCDGATSSTFFA